MLQLGTLSRPTQKPYSCQYASCAKRYTDPSSLRKHLRAHKRAGQPETTGGGVASNEIGVRESGGSVICGPDFDPAALLPAGQFEGGQPEPARYQELGEFERHFSEPETERWLLMEPNNEQQESRYSRSWCAGLTRPLESGWACGGDCQAPGQPIFDNDNHTAVQRQHDALGRSLPPGGGHFRAAHSAASSSFAGKAQQHLSREPQQWRRSASLSCPNCGSLELSCQGCQNTGRADLVER